MPAISTITVADNVPNNHTFQPLSASIASSTWAETSANVYAGNARLAIAMSPPSTTRKTTRVKVQMTLPYERLMEGVYVVSDTAILTCEAVIPSGCSATEAAKAYAMWKNLISHATVQAYIADRAPVY